MERGGFDILVVEIVRKGNCRRRPIQLLIRTPLWSTFPDYTEANLRSSNNRLNHEVAKSIRNYFDLLGLPPADEQLSDYISW